MDLKDLQKAKEGRSEKKPGAQKGMVEVTEHRIEVKKCPCCGETSKGVFPERVTAHTQYDKQIQALPAYFSHQHFLSFDRLSQMFKDIFGIDISPGTCTNIRNSH